MDKRPTICNLCGGKVIYTTNDKIYGKKYGSGHCYYCEECGAYVGTHKPRPKESLGILANAKMREMKKKCHAIFDTLWSTPQERKKCYKALAEKLSISVDECHFGYFDIDMLNKAYDILRKDTME